MSYKLYTDKKEIFECKITLEGASLKDAKSRIVVNTPDLKLMFEGTIDNQGNCKVPIRKLRGLLGESDKGTIKLEDAELVINEVLGKIKVEKTNVL